MLFKLMPTVLDDAVSMKATIKSTTSTLQTVGAIL